MKPKYKKVPEGYDLLEFVLAANVERRQLNISQRSMAAARLEGYGHGGDRTEAQDGKLSLAELAARFRVSSSSIRLGRTVIENCDPSVIAAVESGEIAVSDAARQYVWTSPPDIQEAAVEIYRQPGAAMTLAHCIDKICQEEEMEARRKKAVADHNQAIAEKEEEERLKKLKESGLSEDEFAKEEAARKAALEAEQEEKEKVYQNEFEMLDDIDPIPPLPFFDENGEPCHVDDIWEVAGDKIVDTKSRASRKVYIAADTEGLLFFRSAENAKKFGIKHVLEMLQK